MWQLPKADARILAIPCLPAFCLCHQWAGEVLGCLGSHLPNNVSGAMATLWTYGLITKLWRSNIIVLLQWPHLVFFFFFFFHVLKTFARGRRWMWVMRDGETETAFLLLERCGMHKAMQTGILMGTRGRRSEGTLTLVILRVFRMHNCSLFNTRG